MNTKNKKESWQRARSEDQIKERIDAILNAAGDVFKEHSYEDVTMKMIADKAGFTRSNLYRYFKTREEIFLALYQQDTTVWVNDIVKTFEKSRAMKPETFVKKWMDVLLKHQRFLELNPLLALSLEKNASDEIYLAFKIELHQQLSKVIEVLKKPLPKLNEAEIYSFLLIQGMLICGGWPMSQYTDQHLKLLESAGLGQLRIEFEPFYRDAIVNYLHGLSR